MSSIYRLIVREHSFLPINTKTSALFRRKLQVCLFADKCSFDAILNFSNGQRYQPRIRVNTDCLMLSLMLTWKSSVIRRNMSINILVGQMLYLSRTRPCFYN